MRLHQELTEMGVPVVTVRGIIVDRDPPDLAQFAVVVTEDKFPPNILELINSHVENRIPRSWSPPDGKTLEEILKKYEEL